MHEEIGHDLERILLKNLFESWRMENRERFRLQLGFCSMELADLKNTLAKFQPERRAYVFSRQFLLQRPWGEVLEVLRHEMAHQYVFDVLKATDETAHGPAFQRVCHDFGIDARASGLPEATDGEHDRVLRRIRKLLALGESPNENEARAAVNAAQRMMLEHNVAWTQAQGADYASREIGEVFGRVPAWCKMNGSILGEFFLVRPIYTTSFDLRKNRWGKVLEISGTRANLEVASYVHDFLDRSAERLWKEYRRQHGPQEHGEGSRFKLGVMLGFRDQLRAQQAEQRETGLVYKGDPGLDEYVDRRWPQLRSSRRIRYDASKGYLRGRQAGRSLQLRHGVGGRGTPLLTDGGGR